MNTTFAGLPVSADLSRRILQLAPSDRVRLEERVHERRGRRWVGGRQLSAVMEKQLFAHDTAGHRYFRALMRLDRRVG